MFNGQFSSEEILQRAQQMILRANLQEVYYLFPDEYKKYCGEFPTASAFAFWYAYKQIQTGQQQLTILIYNTFLNNHSFILLKQAL